MVGRRGRPHTTLGTQGVLVFHEDSDDQRGQVQRATRTAQSIRTELDTTLEGLSGRLRAAHVELRRAADSAAVGSTGSGATGGIAAIAERISASATEDLATSLREGSVSNVAGRLDAGAAYADRSARPRSRRRPSRGRRPASAAPSPAGRSRASAWAGAGAARSSRRAPRCPRG